MSTEDMAHREPGRPEPSVAPIDPMDLAQTTIHCAPHAFIDKRGNPVLIKPLSERHHPQLRQMYLDYQPRDDFAGLPPIRDEECLKWVDGMIAGGVNLVAVMFDKGIIGHTAIFPMGAHACEMLIVLAREHQNCGIGTQLTRTVIQLAYELEFDRVWLSVGTGNRIAQHMYAKCGFESLSRTDDCEIEMAVDLRRYYRMTGVTVRDVMNRRVVAIHEQRTCREAIEVFIKRRVAALPVVDDAGCVIGILSETDLVIIGNYAQKVVDLSTKQVVTVRPSCSLSKVVRLFQSKKIRCIPVLDDDRKLVGMVGRRDILAYYCKEHGLADAPGCSDHSVDFPEQRHDGGAI